jgi:hypothetical protein
MTPSRREASFRTAPVFAGERCDHGAVGRPPADVATSFVEIAIDDLDHVEREVCQTCAASFGSERFADVIEFGELGIQIAAEASGDLLNRIADATDLLRDDCKSTAMLTSTRGLDLCIDRQHACQARDLLNLSQALTRDLTDFVR